MSLVWIPNILSLGNLFFGFTAMLAALRGRFDLAIVFVFISMVLDMFDGRVARMIKRDNPIGKDLDSFADMISFGVVPGVVFYAAFLGQVPLEGCRTVFDHSSNLSHLLVGSFSFIFPVAAAIRLARFNVSGGEGSFQGCPSPVAGGTLVLLIGFNRVPAFFAGDGGFMQVLNFAIPCYLLAVVFLLLAVLMVVPVTFAKVQLLSFSSFHSPGKLIFNVVMLLGLIFFFKFCLLAMAVVYIASSLFRARNRG